MGQARDVMDRLTTAAIDQHDLDSAMQYYADDAVVTSPDTGEVRGRHQISEFWRTFVESFPDSRYEALDKLEAGDHAVDEGWFIGTNTEPLHLPTGQTVPATGKRVKLRACDVATVENGKITQHHVYYDQLELMNQLGLAQG